ncbi:MAG: hypothetical protein P8N68_17270 [Paracoccaceae bacterium]|nr:hypothetical protein [Paracoccaceae bacterium]
MPLVFLAFLFFFPTFAIAERYRVVGEYLFFDMGSVGSEMNFPAELTRADVEEFSLTLMDNPSVNTVVLSGPGGEGRAGFLLAEKIMNMNLNTVAREKCASACAIVFLAGNTRILGKDAKLGWHRPSVYIEDEKKYFEAMKDKKGWQNEFDYVPFVYDVSYRDALETIGFMISRGVDIQFILRSQSEAPTDLWIPTRQELFKANVITSIEDAQLPLQDR